MKKIREYLIGTVMLLITLNPFSSYAYSTRYSQREVPRIEIEQVEISNYSEFLNQMMINIPILPVPERILNPTKSFKRNLKPIPLPPAPKEGALEKTLKPVKEIKLEFP